MSGILDEIRNLLNRARTRARLTVAHAPGRQVARLGRISDFGLMRELLKEMDRFLEIAELSAESRYTQSKAEELRDVQQVYDLNSVKTLSDEKALFDVSDVGTVSEYLRQVSPATFGEAFSRQEQEHQRALFVELRKAINKLQKDDGILAEPEE